MTLRLFLPWLLSPALIVCAADPVAGDIGGGMQKNDIVAFVGGEDAVAASEHGYFEMLMHLSQPDGNLRFRSLAWEGDTVFEQPRMLNYPPLEKQLDEIGATVVMCRFGQMESLAGAARLEAFIAAYEALIIRLRGGGRRVILLASTVPKFEPAKHPSADRPMPDPAYAAALPGLAKRMRATFHSPVMAEARSRPRFLRDGLHLNALGHALEAGLIHPPNETKNPGVLLPGEINEATGAMRDSRAEKLRQFICEKNRLWFDYYRPQNWAFLAGDRTSQPSSRDYRDPSKRWFPAEMQEFLPLIEAREKEIQALAKELSQTR